MRVYRIEHHTSQVGPFQEGRDFREFCADHARRRGRRTVNPWNMPTPYRDTQLSEHINRGVSLSSPNMVFGFVSMKQLRRWFKPAVLQWLAAEGFGIACYDTTVRYDGCEQCVFYRPTSRLMWFRLEERRATRTPAAQ